MIQQVGQYEIAETTTGPRCGNHGRGARVRHQDVANIRECYRLSIQAEADIAAEMAAEQAIERALEDGGYWEARAQEEYEERTGVIPFHVAYAEAVAAL